MSDGKLKPTMKGRTHIISFGSTGVDQESDNVIEAWYKDQLKDRLKFKERVYRSKPGKPGRTAVMIFKEL